eukprot:12514904-Ditylum_brightwellii.AAC.1
MAREKTRCDYSNCSTRFFVSINIIKNESKRGTVQEDDPEESDSDDRNDLDKDDDAFADLNNAASDEEDGIDD